MNEAAHLFEDSPASDDEYLPKAHMSEESTLKAKKTYHSKVTTKNDNDSETESESSVTESDDSTEIRNTEKRVAAAEWKEKSKNLLTIKKIQ